MQHRFATDQQQSHYPATFKGHYVPGTGYMLGWGTATPTDQDWAPGALYQVVSAASAALYKNDGTSAAASWTAVSLEGGLEDFGTLGLKADVIAESTAATGVTIDGVLLKDSLVQSGLDGTAGSVKVYPATADKGFLNITCANQTGDTEVTLTAGAMSSARTLTIRDPGAAASFLTTTDGTAAATTSTAVELTRACDMSTRSIAAGGTLSVTEATHGDRTILLDTAAGSVCTLPAPTVGMRVRFLVTVAPTSNFNQVKVAAGTDFMAGIVHILDEDGTTISSFRANGTADDNIQLNTTTTGGKIGDWLEFEGITSTIWAVRGELTCPTGSNPADPFSAAV